MAKSDPRVPIFVESRISLRQKSKGAIRYSFSSVLSCIAFTFPSDERSLLDDDKSVKKKPFHRFFFPLLSMEIHFYGSGTSNRNRMLKIEVVQTKRTSS